MTICREIITDASAWKGPDFISKDTFALDLGARHIDAFDAALKELAARGVGLDEMQRQDFAVPGIAEELAGLFHEIQHGRGFVLLRGFPLERYSEAEISLIYWGIGTHFGIGVSQSVLGDRLGHVTDHSEADKNARAYRSARGLGLHTDFSEIVSLLSLAKAKQGGLTRIASAAAIHNAIFEHDRELLAPLYRGFPYYRSGEQAPGDDPVTPWPVPVFAYLKGRLSARYIREYIVRGAEILKRPLEDTDRAAVDCFEAFANSPDIYLEFMLEPGEALFQNNFSTLHARTAFKDDEAAGFKRHLLRLWLDVPGGRPAPKEMELFETTGIARQEGATPSGGGDAYKQFIKT